MEEKKEEIEKKVEVQVEDFKKLFDEEKGKSDVLALKVAELEKGLETGKALVVEKDSKIKELESEIVKIKESPVFKALHTTPESGTKNMMKDSDLPVLNR